MTPREAFKVGFMARCAENGMTQEQTLTLVKQANEKLAQFKMEVNPVGAATSIGSGLVDFGLTKALPFLLAAPPIVGALGGYGAAKLTDTGDADPATIKRQELRDTYEHEAARLRRQQKLRALAQRRPGSVLAALP